MQTLWSDKSKAEEFKMREQNRSREQKNRGPREDHMAKGEERRKSHEDRRRDDRSKGPVETKKSLKIKQMNGEKKGSYEEEMGHRMFEKRNEEEVKRERKTRLMTKRRRKMKEKRKRTKRKTKMKKTEERG